MIEICNDFSVITRGYVSQINLLCLAVFIVGFYIFHLTTSIKGNILCVIDEACLISSCKYSSIFTSYKVFSLKGVLFTSCCVLEYGDFNLFHYHCVYVL
jgi:hypothetical protein